MTLPRTDAGGPGCPACGSAGLREFHAVDGVPVNSCLLVADEQSARAFPRGDLRLSHCPACGFITNTAFDPALSTYSADYEETQGFSAHFRSFIAELSRQWVERYDLRGKHVIEIGCGKGEFLVEMLRAGVGSGVGIDPGVHPERVPDEVGDRASWIRGFFPADLPVLSADAVVCRHTLEHIGPVREFLTDVRGALGDRRDTAVLFELPGTLHVLHETWFWDIYFEHCSYFTAGSLARLFRRTGFEVLDVRPAYDGQYLLVEARPADVPAPDGSGPDPAPDESGPDEPAPAKVRAIEDDLASVAAGVDRFATTYEAMIDDWRRRVREVGASAPVVIWGSGSKGVAFLAALGNDARHVVSAVDINPFKHGRWMAGTGHRIIAPQDLLEVNPALVVAMNATYLEEIRRELERLGVTTTLVAL